MTTIRPGLQRREFAARCSEFFPISVPHPSETAVEEAGQWQVSPTPTAYQLPLSTLAPMPPVARSIESRGGRGRSRPIAGESHAHARRTAFFDSASRAQRSLLSSSCRCAAAGGGEAQKRQRPKEERMAGCGFEQALGGKRSSCSTCPSGSRSSSASSSRLSSTRCLLSKRARLTRSI